MSWLFINMPLDPISETFEEEFYIVSSLKLKHSMLAKKGRFIKPADHTLYQAQETQEP